jgi:hypothetical protein
MVSRAVAPGDHAATFTLEVSPGPTHLQTFFDTGDDQDLGAYYVYIDRLDAPAVRPG